MDKAERERFIEENLGLVHACAKRFRSRGMEYDDLFQAGCMGLVKAADHFELERGYQFSTYAVPVILGEMRRLFREGGTVKVGRALKELSLRAARETERFLEREGRTPAIGELAALLGIRFRLPERRKKADRLIFPWTRRKKKFPNGLRCSKCSRRLSRMTEI